MEQSSVTPPDSGKFEPTLRGELELSPSVREAVRRVGAKHPISAATLVASVLEFHREYGDGRAASVQLKDTSAKQTANEWVKAARELFDDEHIRSLQRSKLPPTFHGRLLVIGLGLLEPILAKQLESVNAFTALVNELHEPLADILTTRGFALYNAWQNRKRQPELFDTVHNWDDDPLLQPEQDLLGRAVFARFLAQRIAAIPEDSSAYSMHIYAPWGAGKSTLLNFLRQELEGEPESRIAKLRRVGKKVLRVLLRRQQDSRKEQEWIVVEFNAWQNQQIQPPWWSLMERIYKQTKNRLNPWERFTEVWWRLNSGRLPYFLAAIALAWLIVVFVLPWIRSSENDSLKAFGESADSVSKILALVATVWGTIFAVNHSLLFGSARAARNYTELTHDPTSEIRRRFEGLIRKLCPKRVAIFIDDLDRCQSRYVVDLLEGMQTLFRRAHVVFVVAADRRWLNACYEDVYGKLESRIREPGKPLGTLFLEKAFRFSTAMPGIPKPVKEYYWQHLLHVSADRWKADVDSARRNAREELNETKSENEIRNLLANSRKRSFPDQRALREEAVVKLATPEIIERIEHTLKPYAPLLEPNPRGMKLLVNGYSANRALAILAEVEIDLHQLALWTILSSRWPQLADYLTRHCDMLKKINHTDVRNLPEELKALWVDPSLAEVVKGGPTNVALSVETLKQTILMQS